MLRLFIMLFISCFFIFSCDNPRSFTLQELENNHYNQLQLRVNYALDSDGFRQIFKEFNSLSQQQILDKLTVKGLELHLASFGFYYLANSYAAAGDFDKALKYHQLAAEDYINPQSLLKLAEYYFFEKKDYIKSYEYLHQSLEVIVEITANDYLHILSENSKDKSQFLLAELEAMGMKGLFDRTAIREKLKKDLPALLEQYQKMYLVANN